MASASLNPGDKEYLAVLRLGLVTDTQDTSGQVLHRTEELPDRAALEAMLPRFTGEISQLPPMYSAIKIGGKKLYELARQGKEVERRPRPVTIHALELVEQTASGDYVLRVRCSKGTYVRTLCHDIGQALGCGGCMAALRRTMAAGFTLSDAVSWSRCRRRARPCCGRWTPCSGIVRPMCCLPHGLWPAAATAIPSP